MATEVSLPGELADRYQVVRLLGRGGMGEVFEALDLELDRRVAVKMLHGMVGAGAVARFRREASLMASLEHPNVARVYDFGVLQGRPFMVLELVEGQDLDVAPPGEDLEAVMLEVAGALEVVHARGVIHRDVKPANIMRTAEGRVLLMDFGLARDPDLTAMTATGAISGSPAYMSPEVLTGKVAEGAADWWAFGVTWYRLARGQLPLDQKDLVAMADGRGLPERLRIELESTRAPWARVVEACLALQPGDRLASAAGVRGLLGREARIGGDTQLRPLSSEPAPSPEGPGNRAVFPVVILAGLAVGFALFRVSRPDPTAPPAWRQEQPTRPRVVRRGPALPEDLGEQVRKQLDEALGRRVRTVDGEVEVLDPDPAHWGELVNELPSLGRFQAWLQAGGRVDQLSEAQRQDLRKADEWFRDQELPRPFFPHLYAAPLSAPVPADPGHVLPDFLPSRDQVSGWYGVALEANRRARRERERLGLEFQAVAAGGDMPEGFPGAQLDRSMLSIQRFHNFIGPFSGTPERRRARRRWFGPAGEALHQLIHAVGRSLAEEPETRSEVMIAAWHQLDDLTVLFHAYPGFTPPALLIGGTVRLPEERLLLALVMDEAASPRAFAGRSRRMERCLAEFEAAAGELTDTRAGRWLALRAHDGATRAAGTAGQHELVVRYYLENGAQLRSLLEEELITEPLVRVLRSWSRALDRVRRHDQQGRELIAWVDSLPAVRRGDGPGEVLLEAARDLRFGLGSGAPAPPRSGR